MEFDGVEFRSTRVATEAESEALDAALGLKKIELRIGIEQYKLLEQFAEYNGICIQHLIRTIIEQRLKV